MMFTLSAGFLLYQIAYNPRLQVWISQGLNKG